MEGCSVRRRRVASTSTENDGGLLTVAVIASDTVYRTMIHPWTSVSFVPVVLVYEGSNPSPLRALQDTKDIMDFFESRSSPLARPLGAMVHSVVPRPPQLGFASMVLELLADEWLVLQAMYWRWGEGNIDRQRDFIAFEFGRSATAGMSSVANTLAVAEKVPSP